MLDKGCENNTRNIVIQGASSKIAIVQSPAPRKIRVTKRTVIAAQNFRVDQVILSGKAPSQEFPSYKAILRYIAVKDFGWSSKEVVEAFGCRVWRRGVMKIIVSFGRGARIRVGVGNKMEETGIFVKCFSLEGQLAKLEVLGSKAIEILQKILRPISGTSQALFPLKKCSSLEAITDSSVQSSFFEHAADLPSNTVLSLTVEDPRDLPKVESVSPTSASPVAEGYVFEKDSNENTVLTSYPNESSEIISSSLLNFEGNNVLFSDRKDLWDSHNLVNPPVEENLLCMEKHKRRMHLFHLDEKNSSASIAAKNKSSRSCPILLLKDRNQNESCVRCSIVLPLSWAKAFWIPLVSCGARAIGFRERHWVACNVGLPCFPNDFPDCKAYSDFMATEAAASDQKIELRPPAMRSLRIPIPPPWDSVRFSFGQLTTCTGSETVPSIEISSCNSPEQGDSSFNGFVARTSCVLSNYLNEVPEYHLLLSPNATTGEKAKFLKEQGKLFPYEKGNSHIHVQRKLCFIRVLLHAYKEGAFEEGAIVCAPHLPDVSLWTSRSEELDGLQISESSMRSYFMQQPSGIWELQTPVDTMTSESHRWPLGYVTTGFVQGSTKPVAVGICEATLLARLRKEQWDGIEVQERKKEIYVFVRSLRSVAYRLALATIVLDQQDEDVSFM
ncbi:hypothetical protein GIB67_038105 [Kingdonia uniflora]|uniref:Uncharacterized protein n=1 Tax=Kingdonia uniflora TaxID=39325 RepID=A0A7J7P7V6_9MAGN|nr:hypothetical protein GIB67_038105 [Kingdonia uniflora]